MKFTKRFLVSLMFILAISIPIAKAQSLSLSVELKQGFSNASPTLVDGTWYGIEGSSVNIHYTFTAPTLGENQKDLKVNKITCKLNGESQEQSVSQLSGDIEFSILGSVSSGAIEATIEYQYTEVSPEGTEAPKETTKTGTATAVSTEKFTTFKVPTCEFDAAKFYSTEDVVLTVNANGGNPSGWKYTWENSETETIENQYTVQFPSEYPKTVTSHVVVKNYAPDGKSVWFSSTVQKPIYFYSIPQCSISADSDKETNFYKNTKGHTWKIDYQGGGDWKFLWNGGNKEGNSSVYCPFESDVNENQLGRQIKVNVKTVADDGHELFSKDIEVATINVYPAIGHKRGSSVTPVYNGTSVEFGPEDVTGGYPNGWTYIWSPFIENQNNAKVVVIPTTAASYTVTATNSYNGKVWDSFTETYKIKVYDLPSASINETLTIYTTEGEVAGKDLINATNSFDEKNKEVAQPYDNVIVGDKLDLKVTPSKGAPTWQYDFFLDGKQITSTDNVASLSFEQTGTHDVEVHAINGQGEVIEPYSTIFKHTFIVEEKPQFQGSYTEIHMPATGSTVKLDAPVVGGKQDGWLCSWDSGEKTFSIDLPVDKNITSKKDVTRKVIVTYNRGGFKRFEGTRTYTTTIWPEPKVNSLKVTLRDKDINTIKGIKYYDLKENNEASIDIDCYDGDILDFAYEVQGGYTGQENCWIWRNSLKNPYEIPYTQNTSSPLKGSDTFVASAVSKSVENTLFSLFLENNLPVDIYTQTPNHTWKQQGLNINVRAWAKPEVNTTAMVDSAGLSWVKGELINVYAGGQPENIVHFSLPHTGGYTNDGWQYVWKEDKVEASKSDTRWDYTPASPNEYTNKVFTVDIKNHIGDNYGLIESYTFNACVWRKIESDNNVVITDNNQNRRMDTGSMSIRKGNTIHYSVSPMKFGYKGPQVNPAAYTYIWTNNASNPRIYDWSETVKMDNNADEKHIEDLTFTYQSQAYGPYGHVWAGTPKRTYVYKKYNRPITPLTLVKKGSGASGTMVCTTSVTDKDLEGHEYYLVFGYQDAAGDHDMQALLQENPGQVRWDSSFSGVTGNIYVYALWRYPGNIEITSGKRFLDSTDDQWDGSSYTGNLRHVIARIASGDVTNAIADISLTDHTDTAYYDLSGHYVGTSTDMLNAGTYICRTPSGSKKIIIR